jgi:hypothetical protein
VHSGCVYVHAACVSSIHDGIIHAWSMCLCNDSHVACLCQGCKVQCMCMHVGDMHTCSVQHACVCGLHSHGI